MKFRVSMWSLRLGAVGGFLGVWIYLTSSGSISPLVLPQPRQVTDRVVTIFSDPSIWSDIRVTSLEVVTAFCIALLAALATVLLLGRSPYWSRVTEGLLAWIFVTPTVVLFPLFILWFDIGVWSKIMFAAVNGFVAITLTALRGVRDIDTSYTRVGKAFGASRAQQELVIRLPAARPIFMSGVRVGAALCFINVMLAELLGSSEGVGFQLARATQTLDAPGVYAYICVVLVMVGFLFGLIRLSERSTSGVHH